MQPFWERHGIYTLIVHMAHPRRIGVGALGSIRFDAGYYAYTGSAWGSGGLKRLLRHLSVAQKKTRRWHIDYLLAHASVAGYVVSFVPSSGECEVASMLSRILEPIRGFGCSDCSCISHLHYCEDDPIVHVLKAHMRAESTSHGDVHGSTVHE